MYSRSFARRGSRRVSWPPAALGGTLVLLAALLAPTAEAQESREREALRRAQQQLYKLQQDNAALQREKLELQEKLKDAEQAVKSAQGEAAKLRRTARALQTAEREKEDLQAKLLEARQQSIAAVQNHQAQVLGLRREIEGLQLALRTTRLEDSQALAKLQGDLKGESNRASLCEEKNAQLYSVTTDLMDRYRQNRGAWEKFLLSEPFTGLKAVEVENLLDDMRGKAAENKIQPSATAGRAAKAQ